jgi:hypothetical protein
MRKADDHDLREALAEEVETLEPSDELWNKIYKRSVVQQEKRRRPWLTGALAMGAAAAVAAVFLVNGQLTPGVRPPTDNGPSILVAPGENPLPQIRTFGGPDPADDRLSVRYNQTMYWHNGESVSPDQVGDLLTLTTREAGDPPPNGFSPTLAPGKEVRAVKGADPAQRIAVQADQGWYLFENLVKP